VNANELMRQIGTGNLMACGARDFVVDEQQLMFRVGSSRKLAKVIVTLTPDDEYTVRYVEMSKRDYSITVDRPTTLAATTSARWYVAWGTGRDHRA